MSVNSSLYLSLDYCMRSKMTVFIFTSLFITNILLLPLFFLVLYLGLQQWRKQRSSSTTATTSHSDFFTYNVVALELISILGSCLYCFGYYTDGQSVQQLGQNIFAYTNPGQTLFHLFTCGERYMAVIHPIAYLGLKQTAGIRIRNIIAGCVWLLCVGLMGLMKLLGLIFGLIANSCLMALSLILVSFCSFSVLCVLNQSGPGEVSGDRERVDQSKQRAFHTIGAIMVVESFRLVGILVGSVLYTSPMLTNTKCAVASSAMWFSFPCSLVLPLLFLQRAGKLPGCKRNTTSG